MAEIKFQYTIPKTKAEIPALIILLVIDFIGWAFHFGMFSWTGGFIWLGFSTPILLWIYKKRKGNYFVQVDENGVSWRENFFSNLVFIPWNYLQRIDYLAYEINFMLKETAQVVSFGTSGLTDDKTEELKKAISDMVEINAQKNTHV